jgi:DNA invertase Pin-like site-specific DNA recombinase
MTTSGTRVYSYIRFSTPGQAEGDSLRRQVDRAERWAAQHGLRLDDDLRLQDLGLSGWTGEARKKGALSAFLAAVQAGRVPAGSILLIEALDRLSREEILDALSLVTDLLKAGIEIVTLEDSIRYSRETLREQMHLIYVLAGKMQQANADSTRKSERVAAGWAAVFRDAQEHGKALSAMCKAWLRVTPDRRYEVIEERAEVIRRIFRWRADGMGKDAITRRLNEMRIEPFGGGRGWHMGPIGRWLKDRAVIGEHHSERHGIVPMPPILDPELFDRVQAMHGSPGRKGKVFRNLLTGMCKCNICGGTMAARSKGERRPDAKNPRAAIREHDYLVCDSAARKTGCTAGTTHHRVQTLEAAVLDLASVLVRGGDDNHDDAIKTLLNEVATLGHRIERDRKRADNLMEALADAPSKMGAAKVREIEAAIEKAEAERDRLQQQIAEARASGPTADRVSLLLRLRDEQAGLDDEAEVYAVRQRMHTLLRGVVDRVVIDPARVAVVWMGGGLMRATIREREVTSVLFVRHGKAAMMQGDGSLSANYPAPAEVLREQAEIIALNPKRMGKVLEMISGS